jgi:hypothetical protein
MNKPAMIDPRSGAITLSPTNILLAGMPLQTFLSSSLASSARIGPTVSGYQWYYVEVEIAPEPWSLSLCFHNEQLETVDISPRSPYDSWNDFSEDYEKRTAAELRKLLFEWLGQNPSKQLPMMDFYSFSWGIASAGLVPQNATASMGVRYKT